MCAQAFRVKQLDNDVPMFFPQMAVPHMVDSTLVKSGDCQERFELIWQQTDQFEFFTRTVSSYIIIV